MFLEDLPCSCPLTHLVFLVNGEIEGLPSRLRRAVTERWLFSCARGAHSDETICVVFEAVDARHVLAFADSFDVNRNPSDHRHFKRTHLVHFFMHSPLPLNHIDIVNGMLDADVGVL